MQIHTECGIIESSFLSSPPVYLYALLPNSYPTHSHTQIRLTGGRTRYEGRVEVLSEDANGTQSWGLVCGETWSTREATVVCRQLGLGYCNQALQVGH